MPIYIDRKNAGKKFQASMVRLPNFYAENYMG